MNKIKVLVADDHKIVRIGLKALISQQKDLVCVGEADDGNDAVRKALELKPDVITMDLMMPGMDGETATAELRERLPSAKVVILTSFSTSDGIQAALDAGASGALMKTTADTTLLTAIRAVAEGKTFISPEVRKLMTNDPPIPRLSDRQKDVLQSLTQGLTNKEIAQRFGLCKGRVEELVNAIFLKLDASNRAEAVAVALRKQLLKI